MLARNPEDFEEHDVPYNTAEELADLESDEAMTCCALELLNSHRNDAYEEALATLQEDTQGWWAEMLARNPRRPRRA
jgi:hypothetical protein